MFLFTFDTDSKKLETNVSQSISAQVSLMLARPFPVWSPCPSSTFSGKTGYHKSYGRFSIALLGRRRNQVDWSRLRWNHWFWLRHRSSLEVVSWRETQLCWTNGDNDSTRHTKNSLCQYVCGLGFAVIIFDLDLGFQIDSVEQPIKSNSMGSGHVFHYWTSSFDNHLDHRFIIFKNVQLRLALRRVCVGGYVIHIWQLTNISISRFSWCFGLVFIDGMFSCPAQVSLG